MKTRILLVLCTLSVAAIASAQEGDISFKSTELAPGLYMLEGQGGFTGGNLGLITGDDGVVLIDDGLEPLVERVRELAGPRVDRDLSEPAVAGRHDVAGDCQNQSDDERAIERVALGGLRRSRDNRPHGDR